MFDPSEDLLLPSVERNTRRSLTEYEREILLKAAETHRCGLWILTMLYCGLRPGETVPLQVMDIDVKNAVIKIRKALTSGSKEIKLPKSDSGIRDVPIPDVLLKKLKQTVQNKSEFEYIFTLSDGNTMMTQTCIRNNWRSFKRHMSLAMGAKTTSKGKIITETDPLADDLVLYCLRHTYCTDLQDAGVDINIAKYLMGHSDISVTANIYTHTSGKTVKIAAGKINKANEKTIKKLSV